MSGRAASIFCLVATSNNSITYLDQLRRRWQIVEEHPAWPDRLARLYRAVTFLAAGSQSILALARSGSYDANVERLLWEIRFLKQAVGRAKQVFVEESLEWGKLRCCRGPVRWGNVAYPSPLVAAINKAELVLEDLADRVGISSLWDDCWEIDFLAGISDLDSNCLEPSPLTTLDPIDPSALVAVAYQDLCRWAFRLRQPQQATEDVVKKICQYGATDQPVSAGRSAKLKASHSPDFHSVHWYGVTHEFTSNQAAIVKLLWQAWENEAPFIGQSALLAEIDLAEGRTRLRDVFKDQHRKAHSAWGKMIASSGKGNYYLKEPDRQHT